MGSVNSEKQIEETTMFFDRTAERLKNGLTTTFRNWIKRDGSTEFKPELNRYHLYVSYACPWAHRALVVRILKGLEHVISYSTVHWFLEEGGWKFTKEYPDPHHSEDFTHLKNVYTLSDPNYDGNITVPTQKIVNNESSEIIRMLNSEFNEYAKNSLDLYPEQLRSQIDSINDEVYPKLNNGVYRAGFAKNQEAYESAFNDVFYMLDKIEAILSKQRYLVDNKILTEADIRLWTTLIRFDPVYVTHFKCNKYLVTKDYPNIYGYMCEIYQMNGIKETVNMFHIKNHYFQSHTHINPTKIVPLGPEIDYTKPHKRDKF
ncbi:unnamed protein product [Didymodactylos carnosus]|uniref:GST C-terminal domain-containing protein n=1 Tax=Didymodactylos carnosus TaxID=1234261 RepID=A0A813YIU0_9BILA|nr:unnamed protein product [Didymodactylos carnosus]CAF0884881.1 unnamed protein product [Didymodactylos carnosus]CAF3512674.1 unnamed protein product [Didymodactylos carnosus]CAF3670324.1 unnamed protein product [Didymodactylos carnosus]